MVAKGFHRQYSDVVFYEDGQNLVFEAPEMRIHYVKRHLNRVEMKAVFGSRIEHAKVDKGIFVTGKTDIAYFACLLSLQHRLLGSSLCKDPVGILGTNHLVMLQKIDPVCLESLQGFVKLLRRRLLGTAIELGHQEDFFAITVPKRFAHPNFAGPVVIVPAVIHKSNSAIDRRSDNPGAVTLYR